MGTVRTDLPEVPFSCVPEPFATLPGATPAFQAVLRAVTYIVEVLGNDSPTREEIAARAGVGIGSVSTAIRFFAREGVFRLIPDPTRIAGRRIEPGWRRAGAGRSPSTNAALGARLATRGRALSDKGARAETQGGARSARAPFNIEEKEEREERDVPSRLVSSEAPPPPFRPQREDGTGRDALCSQEGKAEENFECRPEVRPPDPLRMEDAFDLIKLLDNSHRVRLAVSEDGRSLKFVPYSGYTPESDDPQHDAELMARLKRLKPELLAIVRDGQAAVAGRTPRAVRNEDYPIEIAQDIVREGGKGWRPALELHLRGRWGDTANDTTAAVYEDARSILGPDRFATLIGVADREAKKDAARLLVVKLTNELEQARGRHHAGKKDRRPGRSANTPRPPAALELSA